MTSYEERGLTAIIFEPLSKGEKKIAYLDINMNAYSHKISANGGFDSLSLSLSDAKISLDDWIENGIGRMVVVYNQALEPCWEGFVNIVKANMGQYAINIGPLVDMGNQVLVAYTPVDYTTSPPTIGSKTFTTIASNEKSKTQFGIIEKLLDGGRITDDDAELIRDTYLVEKAYPETASDIKLGQMLQPDVILECLGWWYWSNLYFFNDATTGASQVDDRITNIINGNPNVDMYASPWVDANNALIPAESEQYKTGMAHLKPLLSLGGASDQRYTLGFYEGRKAYYKEIPSEPAYKTRMSEQGQQIMTYQDALVFPWDVRPAQWLFISDALIGRHSSADNKYEDPRFMFIETVQYRAPWEVTLSGRRVGTYEQIIARFGLGDF